MVHHWLILPHFIVCTIITEAIIWVTDQVLSIADAIVEFTMVFLTVATPFGHTVFNFFNLF
jgi:hypothetical protein